MSSDSEKRLHRLLICSHPNWERCRQCRTSYEQDVFEREGERKDGEARAALNLADTMPTRIGAHAAN